ncbi:MAG: type II secretion system F family protein [Planctomycetota bacterium]|jgi:type IV pilus assembly protein PilC
MAGLATKNEEFAQAARESRTNGISGGGAKEKQVKGGIGVANGRKFYSVRVTRSELILFTTQLSVMLDSGVVLSDALDSIADSRQLSNKGPSALSEVIKGISTMVKDGDNLSKALVAYPKVFNSMFVSMVKASEASGKMAEMLSLLSRYLNFEFEIRKRVKGALIYPCIMLILAIFAMVTMLVFVLPRFTKIYESRGVALPKLTLILVNSSKLLGDFRAMTVVLTLLIIVLMVLYYWFRSPTGRRVIDYLKIHTPVLRTIFIDMVITRSTRIMATMINTGVNLLGAIEVMKGAVDNSYFQSLWTEVDKRVRDGHQLSDSIAFSPNSELIESGIIQMLRAGEKSGRLGEVSGKISVFYENKLTSSIKSVTVLIEPLMIIILGGIIGVIAIALLLPIFKISSVIAH